MTLFDELREYKFFPLVSGGAPDEDLAREVGVPLTYNGHHNTVVVYDEGGAPWIRSRNLLCVNEDEFARRNGLRKTSVFVPHSNDGGYWKREMERQWGIVI